MIIFHILLLSPKYLHKEKSFGKHPQHQKKEFWLAEKELGFCQGLQMKTLIPPNACKTCFIVLVKHGTGRQQSQLCIYCDSCSVASWFCLIAFQHWPLWVQDQGKWIDQACNLHKLLFFLYSWTLHCSRKLIFFWDKEGKQRCVMRISA